MTLYDNKGNGFGHSAASINVDQSNNTEENKSGLEGLFMNDPTYDNAAISDLGLPPTITIQEYVSVYNTNTTNENERFTRVINRQKGKTKEIAYMRNINGSIDALMMVSSIKDGVYHEDTAAFSVNDSNLAISAIEGWTYEKSKIYPSLNDMWGLGTLIGILGGWFPGMIAGAATNAWGPFGIAYGISAIVGVAVDYTIYRVKSDKGIAENDLAIKQLRSHNKLYENERATQHLTGLMESHNYAKQG
jgi:hypothetical protein